MRMIVMRAASCLAVTAACLVASSATAQPAAPKAAAPNAAQDMLKEVQVAADAFSKSPTIPAWVDLLPLGTTIETTPLVVVHADSHFLVADQPTYLVHRAHKVNDAAVLQDAGQWPLYFNPAYQKLTLHRLKIWRGGQAMDRMDSVNIRFLQREMGFERGMYSGMVTCALLIDDVRLGDTIEIVYAVQGDNPVMGGKFSDFASWDQQQVTELRRVTLNHPTQRDIAWRYIGPSYGKPPKAVESTTTIANLPYKRVRFEGKSLKASSPENYFPPHISPDGSLQFSEYKSWQDITQWADGLFTVNEPLAPELKAAADTIRQQAKTPEDQASAALSYVQSEIRYFSVSLGESSHRPSVPSQTLQRRYGDCKDKSLMLVTLLRELGITAHVALANLRSKRVLQDVMPTPYAFDHAVVRALINGKTYDLDPTRQAQRSRLDRIGQTLEGFELLVIAPDSKGLVLSTNPDFAALEFGQLEEKAVVSKLGEDGQLSAKQTWHGTGAEYMRQAWARTTPEQRAKFALETYERRLPGIKLKGDPTMQDDLAQNVFTLTTNYEVPKLSVLSEGDWLVRYAPRNFSGYFLVPGSATDRKLPLYVPSYPASSSYSFEVEFPKEVSVINDPDTRVVRNKAFTYTVSQSFRGNVAKVNLDIKALAPQIEAKEVAGFIEDLRKIDKAVRGYVLVRKSDIKSTGFLGIGKKDIRDTMKARLNEALEKYTKTINNNSLTGNDLADAFCARAETYSDLGKIEEARNDAAQAVKLAPSNGMGYGCRASILFAAGDFQKSINDASKALSLGDTQRDVYRLRGQSKFYLGQYESALEDFQKSLGSATETEARQFTEIWASITSLRLQKPAPAQVLTHAKEKPKGDWPRPALAMLNGLMSPEELLRMVDAKQGDEKVLTQTEAYFYLGQYWLGKNDKAQAKSYFEKSREQGITMYVEHIASGFELQQLLENK